MRRLFGIVAAIGLLGMGANAFAATTVIDFNDQFGWRAEYQVSGVTFSQVGGANFPIHGTPNGTPGLAPGNYPANPFQAVFSAPVSSVSVDLGDFGGNYPGDEDLLFLEIFAGEISIGYTSFLIPENFGGMTTLSLQGQGITRALFGSNLPSPQGSTVYADNFSFSSGAAVPEPSTWAMLIAGFGVAGSAIRSQRKVRRVFAR